MRSSLSVKILLRLGLILLLGALVMGVFAFFQLKLTQQEELDHILLQVSKRLSSSLVTPLWNLDKQVVEGIVVTEMQERNIYGVVVRDNLSDRNIVAKGRDDEWKIIDLAHPEDVDATHAKTLPIVLKDNALGSVTTYLTDQFLFEQLITELSRLLRRMAVLLLLVMAVLIACINIIVSRPILALSKVCSKVAQGNYGLELDTERRDEIGSLARSFSQMKEAIREKIEILNEEIKERKSSEEQLRKLRSFLTGIVDSMPSVLISLDHEYRITQWNKEAESVTGIDREKALGRSSTQLLPYLDEILGLADKALREGQVQRDTKCQLKINGDQKIFDIAIYPLDFSDRQGVVVRLDDVTDRVRLEEVMIQTEKMMSVGGLAAGMAHEINNPLAGIMQSAQVLHNRLSSEMKKNREVASDCQLSLEQIQCYLERRGIGELLHSITQSGERASRIISNMLSFSRKSTSRYTPCNLVELLDSTIELAANDYDLSKKFDFRKVRIMREYEDIFTAVRCDKSSIQQVFFNILKNAAQALAGSKKDGEEPTITIRLLSSPEYAVIEIEDNGAGMDDATRKRIFEPFYTTKNVGLGTGLGLSVSFFIIKENHKGRIQVRSAPGKGSTFIISLPWE